MFGDATITIAAFTMAVSMVLLISMLIPTRTRTVQARLESLKGRSDQPLRGGAGLRPAKPKTIREAVAQMQKEDQRRDQLRDRLVQAGLYKQNSALLFTMARLTLAGVPVLLAVVASSWGYLPLKHAVFFGAMIGGLGTIIPGFWVDYRRNKRQLDIRRAMPDALDVIVVCLEGGLSLPGAIQRVSTELRTAHRTLAAEMLIVQREIQLGRSTGEALQRFANRFDVEELRSLASVIMQAERFGASVIKALKVHADTLRLKRRQKAEEMAQKASVKLVFPTVLFIFPSLFVVLVGPAVFDIIEMFTKIKR